MAHPNTEVLRTLYDAFSRRDVDTVRGLLADDVVFHQPGRNRLSGDYVGHDAVLGLISQLGRLTGGTFRIDVHDLLGTDDHGVGLLRLRAAREGRDIDMPLVHVMHIRDGKVAEFWAHPADQYAVDEFWA